jgi:hypothetical protein
MQSVAKSNHTEQEVEKQVQATKKVMPYVLNPALQPFVKKLIMLNKKLNQLEDRLRTRGASSAQPLRADVNRALKRQITFFKSQVLDIRRKYHEEKEKIRPPATTGVLQGLEQDQEKIQEEETRKLQQLPKGKRLASDKEKRPFKPEQRPYKKVATAGEMLKQVMESAEKEEYKKFALEETTRERRELGEQVKPLFKQLYRREQELKKEGKTLEQEPMEGKWILKEDSKGRLRAILSPQYIEEKWKEKKRKEAKLMEELQREREREEEIERKRKQAKKHGHI